MATTFADLGVSKGVVNALTERGITDAFPIQAESIEAALEGRDICGKAPTGSGKTLAFGIPVVDLVGNGSPWQPAALILAPTRELATQIKDELAPLAKQHKKSVLTTFGGTNIQRDRNRLEQGVDILVACPGRLEDLISRRWCDLRDAGIVVVDEADRMADMGFLPAVKRLLDQTPNDRHTLLFSATLDGDVDQLIKRYQTNPLTVEVEEQVSDIGDVDHSWYLVQPSNRIDSAITVLEGYESAIVFCRTRRGCDRVAKMFNKRGLKSEAIHGDRSQGQRERALRDFTEGKARVLVATDVAARGIHVDNVSLVMHYDPAGTDKDYIHRSGRTGRAGADGRVITMVVEDKQKVAKQLQKDLGIKPGFEPFRADDQPTKIATPSRSDNDRANSDHRKHADRNGNRGGRDRDDRGARSRNDNRGSRDRDDRGARSRNDGRGSRDDGRGARSRDDDRARKTSDRPSGRAKRDDDKSGRPPQRRGRPKKNDWFPPEKKKRWSYDDDARGSRSSNRGPARGGRDDREKDDDRKSDERKASDNASESPHGGSGTEQRKPRSAKGRHADRGNNTNKGRRRPKSRD